MKSCYLMPTIFSLSTTYMLYLYISVSTAAINVMKVTVTVTPTDDDVIPVVFELQDDSIVEPVDFYQLTIVNVSDPNMIVGDFNTTFIIVNDDDEVVGEDMIIYNIPCNIRIV